MGKQPSISQTRHARIIQFHLEELFYRQIQKKMQRSLKAVQTVIYNYKDTGCFKDKESAVDQEELTQSKKELFIASLQVIEDYQL